MVKTLWAVVLVMTGAPRAGLSVEIESAANPVCQAELNPEVQNVLKAFKGNLPTDKKLEWYTLDWVNTLGEAKERAARENKPILWIQTNKEGDLFCSLC